MFDNLTGRFQEAFRKLTGKGELSEKNMSEAFADIRSALLEADVNFDIVKQFMDDVKQACLGQEVLKSVTPGQQTIKIVHDKLIELMGGSSAELDLSGEPTVIMLCGLHGSGKTTTCAKLALFLQKKHRKRVMFAACDVYRPAAIDQLEVLGKELSLPVYSDRQCQDVPQLAKRALQEAKERGRDLLIIDTAGRLQVDEVLVQELVELKNIMRPQEILLVADSALGQEAVSVAKHFDQALDLSGIILTKLDGDARGGAALSMRQSSGKPIKFVTVGERVMDLEAFHPDRMASRILGMGDVVSLVEKAAEQIKEEEAQALQQKILDSTFSFDDFLDQLNRVRRMGGLMSLLKFIPGMNQLPKEALDEKNMKRSEGMIHSMTQAERKLPEIINASRKRRIAKGSGHSVDEVNQTIKQFMEMRKIMAQVASGKMNPAMLGQMLNPSVQNAGPGMSPGSMPMPYAGADSPAGISPAEAKRKALEKARKDARRKMAKASKKKNRRKK
ncbi:MAG: signal recognition particle protein [Lentisphaeria bacterium]|jgi:signal recognition particle subunit SRP54|nr:signal recognition particle protein [Lentisphaeria bacterium]MDY0175929.1 signal recognition particle protein [Lentisphaeria bacterium]NLZ59936.1 signal recognition particle protein [Lentisphaerota bacterium]